MNIKIQNNDNSFGLDNKEFVMKIVDRYYNKSTPKPTS